MIKTDKTNDMLPWRRTGVVGSYNRDQLTLDASSATSKQVFVIRKQRPNEPHTGFYCGYHNDARISDQKHEFITGAKAETEAYFYSLPEFKGSGNAVALEALKEIGAADFATGTSLQHGFATYEGVARENWLSGWLKAYAQHALSGMTAGIAATTRANSILESDLVFERARVQSMMHVFEFAIMQNEKAVDFLRAFVNRNTNDWPEWSTFLASKMPKPEPVINEQTR